MIPILIRIIQVVTWLLILIVIADIVLSYFMSPWHPIKRTLDRVVQPMLAPIRKVVPPMAMIDFSPVILIILIQIIEYVLISLLLALR